MNKANAIDYIAQVKTNMVAIGRLIDNFFSEDANLQSLPSMQQLTSDLKSIQRGMVHAEMMIGVATSKIADLDGDDADNIGEEMSMLEDFNESMRKVKDPLIKISSTIDTARAEAGSGKRR